MIRFLVFESRFERVTKCSIKDDVPTYIWQNMELKGNYAC